MQKSLVWSRNSRGVKTQKFLLRDIIGHGGTIPKTSQKRSVRYPPPPLLLKEVRAKAAPGDDLSKNPPQIKNKPNTGNVAWHCPSTPPPPGRVPLEALCPLP